MKLVRRWQTVQRFPRKFQKILKLMNLPMLQFLEENKMERRIPVRKFRNFQFTMPGCRFSGNSGKCCSIRRWKFPEIQTRIFHWMRSAYRFLVGTKIQIKILRTFKVFTFNLQSASQLVWGRCQGNEIDNSVKIFYFFAPLISFEIPLTSISAIFFFPQLWNIVVRADCEKPAPFVIRPLDLNQTRLARPKT